MPYLISSLPLLLYMTHLKQSIKGEYLMLQIRMFMFNDLVNLSIVFIKIYSIRRCVDGCLHFASVKSHPHPLLPKSFQLTALRPSSVRVNN